jgi:hypothetical protein
MMGPVVLMAGLFIVIFLVLVGAAIVEMAVRALASVFS